MTIHFFVTIKSARSDSLRLFTGKIEEKLRFIRQKSEFTLAFYANFCIIRALPSYAHFGKVEELIDSKGSND